MFNNTETHLFLGSSEGNSAESIGRQCRDGCESKDGDFHIDDDSGEGGSLVWLYYCFVYCVPLGKLFSNHLVPKSFRYDRN